MAVRGLCRLKLRQNPEGATKPRRGTEEASCTFTKGKKHRPSHLAQHVALKISLLWLRCQDSFSDSLRVCQRQEDLTAPLGVKNG